MGIALAHCPIVTDAHEKVTLFLKGELHSVSHPVSKVFACEPGWSLDSQEK
jgi:hypothetical protein